jgi:hypothetical protein
MSEKGYINLTILGKIYFSCSGSALILIVGSRKVGMNDQVFNGLPGKGSHFAL